jgi:hypothetical protein
MLARERLCEFVACWRIAPSSQLSEKLSTLSRSGRSVVEALWRLKLLCGKQRGLMSQASWRQFGGVLTSETRNHRSRQDSLTAGRGLVPVIGRLC